VLGHFKRRYGASPLHLLAHIVVFAIVAYAIAQLLGQNHWVNWLGWFLAAAVLHDVVLLPAYSLLDSVSRAVLRRRPHRPLPGRDPRRPARVPIVNHVRAPALISGLLLLVYFPLILGPAGHGYLRATGQHPSGYLRNWLLITLTLCAASAVIYAVRVGIARSSSPGSASA
jgi:hypothetical protein